MAILNVIQYTQKVPNNSAPQLPAKPLWTDSGEEPVKSLPISGVAGNSDWQKGPARDSEDTAQVIQGVRADKSGAGGQVVPREGSDDDDDDLPLLNRFLARYKPRLLEEEPGTKSSAEESDDQVLDHGLLYPQELRTGSSSDEPIELDSDSKLSNDDAEARYSPRTLNNGRMDQDDVPGSTSDDSNLGSTARPSVALGSASLTGAEVCSRVIDADQDWKVRKIIGRGYIDGVLHYSMPEQAELVESCSYGDGREVAGGNANSSEFSGSNYSINDADDKELQPAKRQKRDTYSPNATPLKLSNTEKSEPASLAMDFDQEWEIRNIVDRKAVGGIVYYLVDWKQTWMGEFELDGARELVDTFVAQSIRRESWDGAGEECCSRRGHKIRGSDLLSNGEPKKRGRPRKQTCS